MKNVVKYEIHVPEKFEIRLEKIQGMSILASTSNIAGDRSSQAYLCEWDSSHSGLEISPVPHS